LEELGALFEDRYFGELMFLVKEGVLIVPSHMGQRPIRAMHGYHPKAKHSYAVVCTNQQSIPDEIAAIPDMFRLITYDSEQANAANRGKKAVVANGKTVNGATKHDRHQKLARIAAVE